VRRLSPSTCTCFETKARRDSAVLGFGARWSATLACWLSSRRVGFQCRSLPGLLSSSGPSVNEPLPLRKKLESTANELLTDFCESGVVERARREPTSAPRRHLPLAKVEDALAAQRALTAVERFALREEPASHEDAGTYRSLLPLTPPRPGEQYAFEVDLDACTGCKACVAACHTLNGLDPGETFRTVGLLTGGNAKEPRIQTVTSSCHHCLEPACLTGCPVGAYEKDPLTGIVRHLDDQCFGCQYCTLMCPYDAPKYNEAKGVVRKCDMCSDRLAHGEAPACVQACPNEAIAIRIVENAVVAAAADARHFVRGAADRDGTLPTTTYKTRRATPDNLLPVDYYRVEVSPAHFPLVVMLTLTQWSVGLMVVPSALGLRDGTLVIPGAAALLLAGGLFASLLHLGRPWLAFRAVLGVRTSWLSREVLAFGVSMKLALLSLAVAALPALPVLPGRATLADWGPPLANMTPALGLLSVLCSVMVYAATRRAPWSLPQTAFRFFGTTLLLGAAWTLALASLEDGVLSAPGAAWLLRSVVALGVSKLGFDMLLLRAGAARRLSGQKRMGLVMLGALRTLTGVRIALLFVGGVALPTILLASASGDSVSLTFALGLLLVAAELLERYLFFAAAPTLRMPGSLR
jgi:formate dehydrogenase iron-sulfur subunit